jgi:hypothetical protein
MIYFNEENDKRNREYYLVNIIQNIQEWLLKRGYYKWNNGNSVPVYIYKIDNEKMIIISFPKGTIVLKNRNLSLDDDFMEINDFKSSIDKIIEYENKCKIKLKEILINRL